MACDCDCKMIKVIMKHDASLKDLEWLINDLYEKIGYLKGENDRLKRELDV